MRRRTEGAVFLADEHPDLDAACAEAVGELVRGAGRDEPRGHRQHQTYTTVDGRSCGRRSEAETILTPERDRPRRAIALAAADRHADTRATAGDSM